MTTSGRRHVPATVLAASAAVILTAVSLAGCAASDDDAPDSTATSTAPSTAATTPAFSTSPSDGTTEGSPTAAAEGVTIPVTFDGDSVTPNGERVTVPAGDDVTLTVTADAPGEIHVHSTPEQELEYDAGTTTLTLTNLDQPGVVEVESHSLDKVIVQLQVQ